jgi:heme/copper-type cytochrome/quinol oxidase subunit 2
MYLLAGVRLLDCFTASDTDVEEESLSQSGLSHTNQFSSWMMMMMMMMMLMMIIFRTKIRSHNHEVVLEPNACNNSALAVVAAKITIITITRIIITTTPTNRSA